jgi:K(+)-stimulated pyrophosphate-energized sodium pump
MSNELALWLSIGAGALAVLFGLISTQWILKQPAGSDRMQEIAAAIQEGAKAYMDRQYLTIGAVGVVLFLVLGFVPQLGCTCRSAQTCAPLKPPQKVSTRR